MNDLEQTIADKWRSVKATETQSGILSGSLEDIKQQVAQMFAVINTSKDKPLT